MTGIETDILAGLGDTSHVARTAVRLLIAAVAGGVVGMGRQHESKAAGLRTHMLVCMGAALFVLIPLEAGIPLHELSRVVQGLALGIGFLGGGVIVKEEPGGKVRGLTTAATIWVTAGVGGAIGFGLIWPALISVALVWLVLLVIGWFEFGFERRRHG